MNFAIQYKKVNKMLQIASTPLSQKKALIEYRKLMLAHGATGEEAKQLVREIENLSFPKQALFRISRQIKKCDKCPNLGGYCPGSGPYDADVVFIGEAPGAKEEKQHKPFVGPAGQILKRLLRKFALYQKKEVFITNITKCRLPGNRDPMTAEKEACLPYLWQELSIIQPKLVVTLGNVPTKQFIECKSVTEVRGTSHRIPIPVPPWTMRFFPTYHPAVLLHPHTGMDYEGMLEEDFLKIPYLMAHPEEDVVTPKLFEIWDK